MTSISATFKMVHFSYVWRRQARSRQVRRRSIQCKEDLDHIGAEDLHQLQCAWELQHRVWTSEAVLRQETRWLGYYYRGDYPKLDDAAWHAFTSSRYDAKTGEWQMSKLPVHHIIA